MSHHAQLIELDLESVSSSQIGSPEAADEVIRVGIKKLEEAIDNIIMHRSAPGWIPFLPGVALPNRLALVGASDSVLKLLAHVCGSALLRVQRYCMLLLWPFKIFDMHQQPIYFCKSQDNAKPQSSFVYFVEDNSC
ncbi:hypothetical protein OROMI_013361 [Orobanche minor]